MCIRPYEENFNFSSMSFQNLVWVGGCFQIFYFREAIVVHDEWSEITVNERTQTHPVGNKQITIVLLFLNATKIRHPYTTTN